MSSPVDPSDHLQLLQTAPSDAPSRTWRTVPIHSAATLTGLPQHTLRWYERIGLVPDVQRCPNGRRQYSHRNLEWIRTVRALRATGMPVAMVKDLTAQHREGEVDRPVRLVRLHRARLLALMTRVQRSLLVLDQVESRLRGAGVPAVGQRAS